MFEESLTTKLTMGTVEHTYLFCDSLLKGKSTISPKVEAPVPSPFNVVGLT